MTHLVIDLDLATRNCSSNRSTLSNKTVTDILLYKRVLAFLLKPNIRINHTCFQPRIIDSQQHIP